MESKGTATISIEDLDTFIIFEDAVINKRVIIQQKSYYGDRLTYFIVNEHEALMRMKDIISSNESLMRKINTTNDELKLEIKILQQKLYRHVILVKKKWWQIL